nr:hypothetical protein [Tanacetum cinerariifolium]
MDDPNITMEEYIRLQAKKAHRRDFEADFPAIVYNDALTPNENVSPKPTICLELRGFYSLGTRSRGYTEEIVQDYEQILATIFSRQVNRVHILDFGVLIEEMRQDLTDRLRMVYTVTPPNWVAAEY